LVQRLACHASHSVDIPVPRKLRVSVLHPTHLALTSAKIWPWYVYTSIQNQIPIEAPIRFFLANSIV
jgi:hypothetical protein